MADKMSFARRWESYQPSKGVWFWSCAGSVAVAVVIGFTWGGWMTGGTAMRMASEAADGARAQLAAASCVARFNLGPDMVAQLAALKKAESFNRSDLIAKAGWVTMPGSTEPVDGAAVICAQRLISANMATAAKG